MHNPNSAVERIKNHLAYKLGQAMIEYNKNGGGYLALFKKLYNIKKQHKKEKLIYQETIKVFPTLKYPELKYCPDYNEALKCYFHLSYMLGEALMKADKAKFIGGYFNLNKYIKKAKKEFNIFQEFFKEFDQINSNTIEGIAKNKQLFLKEFSKIKNLLNTHKDYTPIIDNIFHNFDYFIKNFNLIEEWLLSNDFNEKYKKENHPYPSLLDPKKLNDEKEEISYKTIPAELAWEMNLPLPDNYKLVFFLNPCSGHLVFLELIKKYKLENIHLNANIYDMFLNKEKKKKRKKDKVITILSYYDINSENKFIKNLYNKPIIILSRDPIEQIKSYINHREPFIYKYYHLDKNDFLVNKYFKYGGNCTPKLDRINSALKNLFSNKNREIINNYKNINYIDHSSLSSYKIVDIINKYFNYYNIDSKYIVNSILEFSNVSRYFCFIPCSIIIENLEIYVTHFAYYIQDDFININKLIAEFVDIPIGLSLYINKNKQDECAVIKKYSYNLQFFFKNLEKIVIEEENNLLKMKYLLRYLKKNISLRKNIKHILDQELAHIKQHRPDIVASWKYYQEFETMCKELDGKNEIKQIENSSD